MRRVLLSLCLFLPFVAFGFDFDIEARTALFIPKNSTMRDLYGTGFTEYEIEMGIPLNKCFTLFSNLSYLEADGRSSESHYRSEMENWALNFGGKYYFEPWWCLRPYVGAGAGVAHVEFRDHSPYVNNHTGKFGWSALFKLGTEWCFSRYFYVDVFADYGINSYEFKSKNKTSGHNINTGGVKVGGGLGLRF
ncbi:outer membrane protein [Estrella lausannensis]|uniref:Putative secreted protein n=1 Tax=Estrella lausannensis TaxID=483423 RepID=A0A0H5DNF6_9BACT|nr:hypothetical protein [Estrella lausannensis]CRX37727.1 putative secreted protein [Estrella lausannensis]